MQPILATLTESDPPPTAPQAVGNDRFISSDGVIRKWHYAGERILIWTEPRIFETNINLNEKSVHNRLWRSFEPGSVLLDIGAAYGAYTLPALALGAAKAICWSPENYADILRRNLELNGWLNRVEIISDGLWSEPGVVTPNHPHMPAFMPLVDPPLPEYFRVARLDDCPLIATLERIDWVKIDTEGAELEICRGGAETLRRFRPRIVTENHDFKSATIADETAAFLATLGYVERERVPYEAPGVSHSLFELRS